MMSQKTSRIQYFSDIASQEVEWLWYPYIPYGRITIVQGDPGEGKTTFVLQIAALLSSGRALPVCDQAASPQNVIYQSAEDGIADTIKPRLIAAGADCTRIAFIDDKLNPLTLDDERIEHAIHKCNARLLVLDPLQAFAGANSDMHRANDMRPLLHRLAVIAERTRCAIVIVGHMNKATGAKGLYRSIGSIDITAAARSVLLIGRIKDNPSIRVLTHLKSNLALEGISVAFELLSDGSVRWIGHYDISAEDLLSGSTLQNDSKLVQARTLLIESLSKKPMPCVDVYALCKKYGIGERTVDSAKRLENIKSVKMTDGWYWKLDEEERCELRNRL